MSAPDRPPFFSRIHSRTKRKLPLLMAIAACCACGAGPAWAQMRGIVIKDATVYVGDGRTLQHADVVLQGGKIKAVGNEAKTPPLSKEISGRGKFVTPGLIDVWSTLGLRLNNASRPASSKAADAFDRYARDAIEAALRQGVTAVYVPARAGSGIGGFGAVMRLRPGASAKAIVLNDEAALCASLGANPGDRPIARIKAAAALRKAWQDAKDYRRSWEDYEEDLKEYEEKLEERAKKDRSEETKEEEGDEGKRGGRKRASGRRGSATGEKKQKEPPAKKEDEKKEKLKKPAQPAKDRNKEVLLRVLDGEVALRVEAHRPEDILTILDIADEFGIALILEGASGAHYVADRLAEMDVPVVLGAETPPMQYTGGYARYYRSDAERVLVEAGVEVYLGSGPARGGESATRHLALRAARAVGNGLDSDAALEAITSGAARMLGVEKKIGRVADGMSADVVIWSDHPFSPGARVERVFISGREVYRADKNEEP